MADGGHEANGRDWGPQVEALNDTLREHTEQLAEVSSYLPGIAEVRNDGVTTRAVVSHLSTDVRMMSAELARLGGRIGEAVNTMQALERAFTEFAAEMRRSRP